MCQLTIEKKQWYRAISISIFSSLQHNLKEFVTELFDCLFIAVLYAEVNRVFKMKIVQIESKICKFILVVCLKNCIDAAYSYTCRKFRGLSISISACWAHGWTLQKRMKRSKCCMGQTRAGDIRAHWHTLANTTQRSVRAATMRLYVQLLWPLVNDNNAVTVKMSGGLGL